MCVCRLSYPACKAHPLRCLRLSPGVRVPQVEYHWFNHPRYESHLPQWYTKIRFLIQQAKYRSCLSYERTVWIQIYIQSVYSLRVDKLVTTFRVPLCLSPWIRRLWEQVQVCEQVMDCRRDWLIDHCTCIRSKAKCWLPPFLKKKIKLGLWDLVLYVCGVFVCVPAF